MDMGNKVTVIIPTYSRERDCIHRAISSVVSQTYTNLEIIVIDDNAKAEHFEYRKMVKTVVDELADPRIILIQNDVNKGSAATRNVGVFASTGDYVTFLDDDDVYFPDKVKNQLEDMLDKGADYSICDVDLFYTDETLAEQRKRTYIEKSDKNSLLKYHILYGLSGTNCMMFKREYIVGFGGFGNKNFGDDFYLFHSAIEANGVFTYLPRCDFKAYVHRGEAGLSIGATKISGENDVYEFRKQYFHLLSSKEKRYVKMRHFAVLAYAYKRSGELGKFALNGMKAFLNSPINSIKIMLDIR